MDEIKRSVSFKPIRSIVLRTKRQRKNEGDRTAKNKNKKRAVAIHRGREKCT